MGFTSMIVGTRTSPEPLHGLRTHGVKLSRPRSRRCASLVLTMLLAGPPLLSRPGLARAAERESASAAGSAAAASAVSSAPVARTEPPAAKQPSAADRAAAQALFDEGRTLMERGRPADACPRFEQSEKLEPGLGTRFHLANCYEVLGKLASAHALFLEVEAEAEVRDQAERERLARSRARALEPRLARLTIEVPYASSPALRIERDGAVIGAAQWGVAVPVDAGVHRVIASAPGRVAWQTEVEVRDEGSLTRVNVPPLAEQSSSFFAPVSRKVGLVALGVGVGTIALGTVFAVQAVSKEDASNRAGCSDDQCTSEEGVSLRRQALAAGNRATWAMGAGLVGLGAAAALFWLWPTGEEDGGAGDVQLEPVADLNSASLRMHGRF
jgi:hypothetical protein